MAQTKTIRMAVCAWAMAAILFSVLDVRADDSAETRQELRRLEQQNQALQAQLEQQRKLIESLSHKVAEIQEAGAKPTREMNEPAPTEKGFGATGLGKVNIS